MVYGLYRALPGDRLFVTVALRIVARCNPVGRKTSPQNLTPASRRQDHTTSPSATSIVRLPAVSCPRSPKGSPCNHVACRHCCVPRIPPRVRDDREPPLCGTRQAELYK